MNNSFELFIKEFQTLISVSYLLLVGIGMVFNFHKYSEFGINIFQYADVFDFLIAPFQDIFIILFSILSTIIPYAALKFDSYFMKYKPRTYSKVNFGFDKKSWFNAYRITIYSSLFIFYIILAGSRYGQFFKNRIQDQPTLSIVIKDNTIEEGKLIGKTKDIIFLMTNKNVTAIPINSSVVKIEID